MQDRTLTVFGLFLGCLLASSPALAQSGDDASRLVDDLATCRAITSEAERLACYDRTAAAIANARERKELLVVDREEARKTRRGLFGFALPRIKLFGDADDTAEISEITGKVKSVNATGYQNLLVVLEDGSQWQTTEASRRKPHVGQEIRVKRGMMGSYFLDMPGGVLIRARRIQ